jgi:hypothetical protein
MATFGRPGGFHFPASSRPIASSPSGSLSSSTPSSRKGSCNFRDLNLGHKCGCVTFWGDESRLHQNGASLPRSEIALTGEECVWCICGHHACYHHLVARPTHSKDDISTHDSSTSTAQLKTSGTRINPLQVGIHSQLKSQPEPGSLHNLGTSFYIPSSSSSAAAPKPSILSGDSHQLPSDASTSILPPVPSICLAGGSTSKTDKLPSIKTPVHSFPGNHNRSKLGESVDPSGLGLSLYDKEGNDVLGRSEAATSDTHREDHRLSFNGERAHRRIRNLSVGNQSLSNISRGILVSSIEQRHNIPPLVTGDTVPNTPAPDDIILSATEVATPTEANTPDLNALQEEIEGARATIDLVNGKLAEHARFRASEPRDSKGSSAKSSSLASTTLVAPHAPSPINMSRRAPYLNELTQQPSLLDDSKHQYMAKIMSKIAAHLSNISAMISSYPQQSASLRSLGERIEGLEGMSFSFVHPDELAERFEDVDVRLTELENWKEELNNIYRRQTISVNNSFKSNETDEAAAGVDLALCEIEGIKERLQDLEDLAPSSVYPWEVEVVFLPWGPDLKGVWYPPHELSSNRDYCDTDEWSQARSQRLTARASQNGQQSGWSNHDIAGWAGNRDQWLSPKSCGQRNKTFRRLQSRGFVRTVSITNENASNIMSAISRAFDSMPLLSAPSNINANAPERNQQGFVKSLPGLSAQFIPLKRVPHHNRLQFLTPAEMATPAIWDAQFLRAGVLMRINNGLRRLYVTQSSAYMQDPDDASAWTWQKIRELPRVPMQDKDHPMENMAEYSGQIGEADAKEHCWTYCPLLDPPLSVAASFASHHSHQSRHSNPPALDEEQSSVPTRKGPEASPKRFSKKTKQPVSPLSEFRNVDEQSARQLQPSGTSKRRVRSTSDFETNSTSPSPRISVPLTAPPSRPSISKVKRRRISRSPEFGGFDDMAADADTEMHEYHNKKAGIDEEDEGQAEMSPANDVSHEAYGLTPRRSKEPPSPFCAPEQISSLGLSRAAAAFSREPSHDQQIQAADKEDGPLLVSSSGGPTSVRVHAYATPHSGNGLKLGETVNECYEGDTEADSTNEQYARMYALAREQAVDHEEEWEGLKEDEEDEEDELDEEEEESASFISDEEVESAMEDGEVEDEELGEDSDDDADDAY